MAEEHFTLGERADEVVAVHGTPARRRSVAHVEACTVAYRARQALDALDRERARGHADGEHDEIRADLEKVLRVLARWAPPG